MEESPTSSTTSLAASHDCSKCSALQKEVEALRRQEAFFLTLKTKLIKTDALVKKYMSKCQEAEENKNNLKVLECENAELTQKCKILEEELKKTMKETLPWKLSKDKFLEEMENVKNQLENTRLKLSASEALCCQYEQKIESSEMQEADLMSTIQSLKEELRQAELRYKTESQKLKKAKEEALMLRRKLSKQKATRQRYQSNIEKTDDDDDNEDVIEDMSDEDGSDDDGDDEKAETTAKSGEDASQDRHDVVSSIQKTSDSSQHKLSKSTASLSEDDSELSDDEEVGKLERPFSEKQQIQKQDSQNKSQSFVEARKDVHSEEEKNHQNSKAESSDSDGDFEDMQASVFDEDDVNAIEQRLGPGAEDTDGIDRLDSQTDADLHTGHRVSEGIIDTDSEVEETVCGQHKMEREHTPEVIKDRKHDQKELGGEEEDNNNDETKMTKEKKAKNMKEKCEAKTVQEAGNTACIPEISTRNQRIQENTVHKKEESEKFESTKSNLESGLEEDGTKGHGGSDEKDEDSCKVEGVDKKLVVKDDEMKVSTVKPKETCPFKADQLSSDEDDDQMDLSRAADEENKGVIDSKGRDDVTIGEDVKMTVSTEEPEGAVVNNSKEEGIAMGGDSEMQVIDIEPQEDAFNEVSTVDSVFSDEDVQMEVCRAEPHGDIVKDPEGDSMSVGEDVEMEVDKTEPQGGVATKSECGSESVTDDAEMEVIAAETDEDHLKDCKESNVSAGKDAGIILTKGGNQSAREIELRDGQHAMMSTDAAEIDEVNSRTLSHLNAKEDEKTCNNEQEEGLQSLPEDEEQTTVVEDNLDKSGQRCKECPSDEEKRKYEECLRENTSDETAGGSDILRCKDSDEMETLQCETVEARMTEETSKDEERGNSKVNKEGLTSEKLGEENEADKCNTMRTLLIVQSDVTSKTNEGVLGEGSTNSRTSHAENASPTHCDERTANQSNNEGSKNDELSPSITGSNLKECSDSSKVGKVHQRSNLQKLTISCPSEEEQQSENVEVGSAGFDSSELNEIIGTERTGREVHTKMSMGVKTEFKMAKMDTLPCIPEKRGGSPPRRTEKASLEPMIMSILDSLPIITRVLSPIPLSPGRGELNQEDDEDEDELSLHQRTLSPLSPPDASCFLPPFSSTERTLSPLPGTPVPPDDSLEIREDEMPGDRAMPSIFHASAPKGTVAVRPRARSSQIEGCKDDSDRGTKRKMDLVEESFGEQSIEHSDVTSGIKSKKNRKKGLSVASKIDDDGQSCKEVSENVVYKTNEQSGSTVGSLVEENKQQQNKVEKVGGEIGALDDSLSISRKTEPMCATDQKDDIIEQHDPDEGDFKEEGSSQTSNADRMSENKERSFVEQCHNDAQPQVNQPMNVDAVSAVEGILLMDSQGTERAPSKHRNVIPTSESSDLIGEREVLDKTSTINRETPKTNQRIVLSELLESIRTQKTELLGGLVKKVIVFLDQNPVDLLSVQLSKSVVGNKSTRPVLTYPEEELLGVLRQRNVRFAEEILHCLGTLIVLPRMKDDEKLAHRKRLTFLRIYSALCRLKGLSKRLRVLCFDIVIRRVQHWEELLLCVASVWPHILTRQKGRIAQPIINAMELVVWKSLKSKKNTNTSQTETLWQALKFSCDWKDPVIQSEETMVTNLLQSLCEASKKNLMNNSSTSPISNSGYEISKAIEMLAWSKGWKWTWSFVIAESLWPILSGQCKDVFKGSEWDQGLVCVCLKVLGIIGQVERKPHREIYELIERISDFAKYSGGSKSTGVPAIIQAHAVSAILSLSTSCPCFAAQVLKNWSEDPNPQLVKGDKVRLEVLMKTCKGLVDLNAAPEKSREAPRPGQTKRWGQSNETSKKCSRGRKKFRR